MSEQSGIRYMCTGTRPQIIASLTATISAINDGMHYGWSAPVIPILRSEDSPIKILKSDEKWLEIVYFIGGLSGLPLTVYLADKIGRKNSTIVSSCASLLSWILIVLSGIVSHIAYLYIARFLCGLAGDMAFVATPMYVAEISDQKIRGLLASLIYLMMLFGILLIYAVAPFTPFYVPSIIGASLLLFQLSSFTFMPKSPYFLLSKNKVDSARRALNRLRVTTDNEAELTKISKAVERQQKEKGRIQDLILVASNRKAVIIMTVLNGGQHLAGISVMLMNMHSILIAADSVYFTSNTTAILFSSFMFIAALLASFFVDKYGRKFLIIISGTLTGICLLSLAIYFNLKFEKYNLNVVSWIPIVSVMAYGTAFKIGLGMVPIVVSAEIFSNKIKAMGMTLADAMYLIFGCVSIELYKVLSDSCGYHVPFYLFTIFSFLIVLFTVVVIPETKGKTLEEIQLILKGTNSITSTSTDGNIATN